MLTPVVKQTWTILAVLLSSINQGLVLSYPYCLIPALMADDSPIKIDLNTASWLTSIIALSLPAGLFGSTVLMDLIGRRLSNAIMIVPAVLSWMIVYLANDITTLMIGRILGGIGNMSSYVIGCCVMAEYTSPKYRGLFLNLKAMTFFIGSIFMHVISIYCNWKSVAIICMTPTIVAFLINCTWTESPAWLALQGKFKKSEETFYWLRGTDEDSVREFEAMILSVKEKKATERKKIRFFQKAKGFLKKFTMKNFYKPILVQAVAFMLMEVSGRHIFPAFANTIMENVSKTKSTAFLYTITIDVINILSNIVSCVLINFFRRRTLLFGSGSLCLILLVIISLYSFLIANGCASSDQPLIMATLLIVYFAIANVGTTSLPLVLFGELFPLEHRESAMTISSLLVSVFLFATLRLVPFLLATIQMYGTFGILSVIFALDLLYLYFELPETSKRTLLDIEGDFEKGWPKMKKQNQFKDGADIAILNANKDQK